MKLLVLSIFQTFFAHRPFYLPKKFLFTKTLLMMPKAILVYLSIYMLEYIVSYITKTYPKKVILKYFLCDKKEWVKKQRFLKCLADHQSGHKISLDLFRFLDGRVLETWICFELHSHGTVSIWHRAWIRLVQVFARDKNGWKFDLFNAYTYSKLDPRDVT